jgi:GNAT superfamily N-acetyltransferase
VVAGILFPLIPRVRMTSTSEAAHPFADLVLARRLERAEAHSNAAFVESRAKLQPESGACWIEVAGAYALFDGVGSPLTQSFGLGVFDPLTDADAQNIENFFQQRGAEVFHEVSPLADPALLALLTERDYRPIEFTSVLYRPISPEMRLPAVPNEQIEVRRITPGEEDVWADTAAEGWSEYADLAAFMREMGLISARSEGTYSFLAELKGQPIATGGLSIREGVALLAGASTVPQGRSQGAQLALLEARLRFAIEQGCDLAMVGALPGSVSQRNAERQGFRIAYTRIKWQLHRS